MPHAVTFPYRPAPRPYATVRPYGFPALPPPVFPGLLAKAAAATAWPAYARLRALHAAATIGRVPLAVKTASAPPLSDVGGLRYRRTSFYQNGWPLVKEAWGFPTWQGVLNLLGRAWRSLATRRQWSGAGPEALRRSKALQRTPESPALSSAPMELAAPSVTSSQPAADMTPSTLKRFGAAGDVQVPQAELLALERDRQTLARLAQVTGLKQDAPLPPTVVPRPAVAPAVPSPQSADVSQSGAMTRQATRKIWPWLATGAAGTAIPWWWLSAMHDNQSQFDSSSRLGPDSPETAVRRINDALQRAARERLVAVQAEADPQKKREMLESLLTGDYRPNDSWFRRFGPSFNPFYSPTVRDLRNQLAAETEKVRQNYFAEMDAAYRLARVNESLRRLTGNNADSVGLGAFTQAELDALRDLLGQQPAASPLPSDGKVNVEQLRSQSAAAQRWWEAAQRIGLRPENLNWQPPTDVTPFGSPPGVAATGQPAGQQTGQQTPQPTAQQAGQQAGQKPAQPAGQQAAGQPQPYNNSVNAAGTAGGQTWHIGPGRAGAGVQGGAVMTLPSSSYGYLTRPASATPAWRRATQQYGLA